MDTNLEFLLEELRTRSGVIWGDFSGNPNENPTPVTENAPNDITWLVETSTATPSIWLKGGGSWIVIGTDLSSSIAAAQQALADTVVAKDAALSAKTAAEAARDAAFVNAAVYASTAAGLAAVADGVQFQVVSGNEIVRYVRTNVSTATEVARYPAAAMVAVLFGIAGSKAAAYPEKNLFNPDDPYVLVGYALAQGRPYTNAVFRTTGFIPITAGQQYTISHRRALAWFDAQGIIVSYDDTTTGGQVTITAPAGASYLRTCVSDSQLPAFQVEVGAVKTTYAPYNLLTDASAIPDGGLPVAKLPDAGVTIAKAAFFEVGKNKFNKAAATIGYYVSNGGAVGANATYDASDYIPVTPGVTYYTPYWRYTCFYDASKVVIAGGSAATGTTFVAPSGAAYVRVTLLHTQLDVYQLEVGSAATEYESFGYILKQTGSYPIRLESGVMAAAEVAPDAVTPPAIYGVQGRECNLYFDNLFFSDARDYLLDVVPVSNTGAQQNERWTWTPAGALASGDLTFRANSRRSGSLLLTKTIAQRAAASSAGTGTTKKVIVIGDSLVNAGVITQTLLDVAGADVMGVTLHGTRGIAPNLHEGRPGWKIANYTASFSDGSGANPFWIGGVLNFGQYLTNNSIAAPDWVFIALGINDVFNSADDVGASSLADAEFTKLDTLIASIKAADANTKIGLMIPSPPSSDEDSFGASYGSGQPRWRFKRNILIWARQLIAKYAGQEASRIYVVPTNTALDTVNNMSRAASAPVNSRSSVTATRQNNGVHPASSGYQQIGDALWAFLKYYA